MEITGTFQEADRSTNHLAVAELFGDGSIVLRDKETRQVFWQSTNGTGYSFGDSIPGLATELQLENGAYFVPDDPAFRWPNNRSGNRTVQWLEDHWTGVLVAAIVTPLFLFWMLFSGIPAAAQASVGLIPDAVSEKLGEQTLYVLNEAFLTESTLPAEQQQQVRERWQNTLSRLDIPSERYQLLIKNSESFGANAMALPNGTVVVTDDIIRLLNEQPDALTAVLLHEIGHVEHQHSLKLISQSIASSLLFAVLFNDIEGIGELVLGASSGLLQSAFSRDMERDADQFAHQHLKQLGIPATAFADAMQALMSSQPEDGSDHASLLKYFRTHPDTLERIEAAKRADSH